jgi:YgiT-type zinc finger domain-containing protein
MKKNEMEQSWTRMGEEAISGMLEWRLQHPKATLREIEREVDSRLAKMRAKMLEDAAQASESAEWEKGAEEVPVCPSCGAELEKKGIKKRKLQTVGGQEIELKREYGLCPKCGAGIFPPG